jgi:hypothetical protein
MIESKWPDFCDLIFPFLMYHKGAIEHSPKASYQEGHEDFNKLIISDRLGVGNGACCVH